MLNFNEPAVKFLKYFQNFKTDRYLFRILNNPNTRPHGHAANKILRYENGDPYAVHCNCGGYHPVFNRKENRHEVEWSPDFTIRTKNSSSVERELKQMWIMVP